MFVLLNYISILFRPNFKPFLYLEAHPLPTLSANIPVIGGRQTSVGSHIDVKDAQILGGSLFQNWFPNQIFLTHVQGFLLWRKYLARQCIMQVKRTINQPNDLQWGFGPLKRCNNVVIRVWQGAVLDVKKLYLLDLVLNSLSCFPGLSLSTSDKLFRVTELSPFLHSMFTLLMGGLLAFGLSFSEFLLVSYTSSLTLSIAGIFKVTFKNILVLFRPLLKGFFVTHK